jgi:PST family polysaccharide transporter
MLPALSRAAGSPRPYADLVLGFFRFILLLMLPTGVGLAIVAPETMRVLGGPQWAPAGPILAVLALAMPLQSCHGALGWVFASTGHARRLSLASVLGAAVLCGSFSLGLYLGWLAGDAVLGVAVGYTAGLAVVLPPYLVFALRSAGVSCREWLAELHPAAPAAAAMGLVVLAFRWLVGRIVQLPDLPLLIGEVLIGMASYAFLARRAIQGFLREAVRDLR